MIGDRLKDIRTYFDVKQREMAEYLNISRSTYAGYENNIDMIPLQKLNAFCNYFGISLDYVCGLTKIKKYDVIETNIDIKTVASNLRKIRKANNESQEKLADKINIDRSCYTRYELAEHLILTTTIIDFAKHYKVSIDYICGKTYKDNLNKNEK